MPTEHVPMRTASRTVGVVLIVLLCGIAFYIIRNQARGTVRLEDGTLVKLHSITRGTNHVALKSNQLQRMLFLLPARIVPRKWISRTERTEINTPTNAVVVWLSLQGGNNLWSYGITDSDGVGADTIQPGSGPSGTQDMLFPIVLQVWPRRASEIGISFFINRNNGNWPIERLVIQNPARSSPPAFIPKPTPSRERNGDLDLWLVSLDVLGKGETFNTRAGYHWGSRARFQIVERGITNQDWKVQSMWFSDPTGNNRRADGSRDWTGNWFEIFSVPLWLDEPAWKVEADLVRRSNFQPEETISFFQVPMPSRGMSKEAVFHTNLLGMDITLHSMAIADIALRGHSMGAPGFALELDSRNDTWVAQVIGLWDEQGEAMRVPAHGYGPGYSVMRFSAPTNRVTPKWLTVEVTVQQRRRFTFFAKPTLIQNGPQPVDASVP